MAWIKTNIKDVWVFEPKIWLDPRGYFIESYSDISFEETGLMVDFVQDNEAKSVRGVLRGLHFQTGEYAQSKLVRVIKGEVLDVIVDLRPESDTYGQSLSVILNEINKKQLFVPRGFAHGYLVLEDDTIFAYKCDNYYAKAHEGGIKYDDPDLNINWIIPNDQLILSDKDLALPYLRDLKQ